MATASSELSTSATWRDSGWRLIQGQVPYRDFACTLPPGFFLGVKFAFVLFGVRWASTLLVAAIFAGGCFVWLYFLFHELLGSRLLAFMTALCIECVSMLLLGFWWYNNITSVAAAVFLLSCLLFLEKSDRLWPQWSYFASLCLLGFMKPNTAGPLIFAGVVVLLLATTAKMRLLLWTAAAMALNVIILTVNHISISGLLSSYLVAAQGRGSTPLAGFIRLLPQDIPRVSLAILFLLAPFLAWWPQFRRGVAQRDRSRVACLILLVAAALTSVLAMCSNNELKDVDWPLLIVSGVVLLHNPAITAVPALRWRLLLRCHVCFLCALTVTDLYAGAIRYRVAGIGLHQFFEWSGPMVNPGPPFFAGMQAAPFLKDVVEETAQALRDAPRPVYFGPRLEFAYAAFGEPSPKDLAIWWEPKISFAEIDESRMEETWRNKRFPTVILLGEGDSTYYSPLFRKMILSQYSIDTKWPDLTVLRLKGN